MTMTEKTGTNVEPEGVTEPDHVLEDGLDQSTSSSMQQNGSILNTIFWMPPWCRWDAKNPPNFTVWHNILYACAAGLEVANINYTIPILDVIARDFHTSQAGVSTIPTLGQAGYASGMLLVLPLGDFLPRRNFSLAFILAGIVAWIVLCTTNSFTVFTVFTYLSGIFSCVPQIMVPLVTDLAKPEKRAFSLSIVASGGAFGILIARILSGIVAQYTYWRNVYWLALGLQICLLVLLWIFMPDYPASNPKTWKEIAKRYPQNLFSVLVLYTKYPVLVQSGFLCFCTSVAMTQYWSGLTFLLSGAPYHYTSVYIGLFGLVGLASMFLNPIYGKYIIQKLQVPLYSALVAATFSMVAVVIGTYTGKLSVAGPIIEAFLLDAGFIIMQVANRMAIQHVEPKSRNKVNTAFMCIVYLGQVTGTRAGNQIYQNYGGWIPSGSFGVAAMGFAYILVLLRGPHETGWFGWSGGWGKHPNGSKEVNTATEDTRAEAEVDSNEPDITQSQEQEIKKEAV